MIWVWIGFLTITGVLLALDRGVFNKKAHAPSMREALAFTGMTVALAIGFSGFVYVAYENHWLGLGATVDAVRRPEELEAVYEISRAVARAVDMDSALDEIITLARPVFIFDNMVLYIEKEGDQLEPSYARAIGRGGSNEAQLTWGEEQLPTKQLSPGRL